ncbi:MAG TPA: ANTAR domain-containing protein, partial [Nocardioidaceae bacterium]|nr:ANTAR domain-containing protein [Nocardioidaceae bacterium]
TYAGMAFGKTRQAEQLNKALSTRKMIGQAIGIVQERYELNEDRAFQFLARVSQTSNIKLADVAAELVSQANARRAAED